MDLRTNESLGIYCSQLVWLAFRATGLDLDSGKWWWSLAVMPDEIYLDDDVILVDQRPGMKRSVISRKSPVDLLLINRRGQAAGMDPLTGAVVRNIPEVDYLGPGIEPESFAVTNLDGPWTLIVRGTGSGPFTLVTENIERGDYRVADVAGTALPGSLATYLVQNPKDGVPFVQVVSIDIKPRSLPNTIQPNSQGAIPVAILSTNTFNASVEVDRASLTFGRTGNERSLVRTSAEDVNDDGLPDLMCHFDTPTAGFRSGDTQGTLRGQTVAGVPIVGTDSVRTLPP